MENKIAKGIYRPCCNNSTYFPDCNHGMAMLGLLVPSLTRGHRGRDVEYGHNGQHELVSKSILDD